jgi:hypothetical protein
LFAQLINAGLASHISYQRILIDWHAQEELFSNDVDYQPPAAKATTLPFGSRQVQYLLSTPPPSPVYDRPRDSIHPNRLFRKGKAGHITAPTSCQWQVPFIHFGPLPQNADALRWHKLWWYHDNRKAANGDMYGVQRGAYVCICHINNENNS